MLRYPRTSFQQQTIAAGEFLPPPVNGWTTASPNSEMDPTTAFVLDNWFPQPDYLEIRKGRRRHRQTNTTAPVETLMYWQGPGTANFLFAVANGAFYDVTVFDSVSATPIVGQAGFTNSRFQWINFTTPGGSYLWACNGAQTARMFDGTAWSQPAIANINSADVINVAAHKGRIWMILKDSTKAAYLPVGSIQGAATTFELGGLMTNGGFLVAASTWSMDGGDGQDDMLVFVTSRGQAIIYKGTDPASAASWGLVGVYDIGTPMGYRCLTKYGADLAYVSVDGVVPLSQMTISDRSVVERVALTSRIHRQMNTAAQLWQNNFGWEFTVFPRGTKAILNVPLDAGDVQEQYVMNTLNGAWCRFNNWNANTWIVFQDRLFYGGNDGAVHEADIPGADEGSIFTAEMRHAWLYYGQRGRKKRWTMVQPVLLSTNRIDAAIGMDTDFSDNGDINAFGSIDPSSNAALWDQALWDQALWASESSVQQDWYSVGALGYIGSVRMKVQIIAPSINEPTANDRFEFFLNLNGVNVLNETGGYL